MCLSLNFVTSLRPLTFSIDLQKRCFRGDIFSLLELARGCRTTLMLRKDNILHKPIAHPDKSFAKLCWNDNTTKKSAP